MSTSLLVSVVVLIFFTAPTLAQTTPEPAEEGATAVDTSGISANQINEVARTLWCPLCSGVRLDSCELKACEQMREEIAIMLAEGQDREAIRARFIELYGPQVLGEPPREGWNWVAWLLPFVALAVGGGFLWSRARQMMQPAGSPSPGSGAPTAGALDTGAAELAERDEYEQKLEDELEQYN